jgi:A/G-specific adenine glycosylase
VTTSGDEGLAKFSRELRRRASPLSRPLPWIGIDDPWAVLVSEVMLQQTQVARVLEPWRRFLDAFPDPSSCANAPLSSVLRLWAGLGYHRRAKALHDAARIIRDQYRGELPRDVAELRRLPGVGEYTANAVASFAFGQRVAVLDTNVGRVLARAVANRTLTVREARELAKRLLPARNAASHNQAMLDLGAQYCRASPHCDSCPLARVCRWRQEGGDDPAPLSAAVSRRQSSFEGSDRQVRGKILGLLRGDDASLTAVVAHVDPLDRDRVERIIEDLVVDGLVQRTGRRFRLATS